MNNSRVSEKKCPDCGELKSAEDFGVNLARSDGLTMRCKPCTNERARERHRLRAEAEGRALREKVSLPPELERLGGGYKRCPDCEEFKAVEHFGRNRSSSDGLAAYCKPCFRTRSNAQYRRDAAQAGRTVREKVEVALGHKRCPDCTEIKPHSEWNRNSMSSDGYASYCRKCKAIRDSRVHYKQKYGLSPEDVERMAYDQGQRCALCRRRPPEHVDHDHKTGRVRGLLCFNCNAGLGQFEDDPMLFFRAIKYLRLHEPPKAQDFPAWIVESRRGWQLGV